MTNRFALCTLAAAAQLFTAVPALAQTWRVSLVDSPSGVAVSNPRGGLSTDAAALVARTTSATLQVDCPATLACDDVTIAVRGTAAPDVMSDWLEPTQSTARQARFTIAGDRVPIGKEGLLVVRHGNREASPALRVANAAPNENPNAAQTGVPAAPDGQTPITDEPPTLAAVTANVLDVAACQGRDASGTLVPIARLPRVDMTVMANGNAVPNMGLARRLVEGDSVTLRVIGHPGAIRNLTVQRKSAMQSIGAINIVGSDARLPADWRQAIEDEEECIALTVPVRHLAAGKGEIELTLLTDKGPTSRSIDFPVHPRYTGAFGFNVMRSQLTDPSYTLIASGTDSVVAVAENPSARALYVISYIHFLGGRRDVEARVPWYRHINPMIAVVPDKLLDNAVVGVNIDLFGGTVFLSGGLHAAQVTRLNSEAGLSVGDTFDGPRSAIPTTREWRSASFTAVGIDLRAAAQLLTAALKSAAGGS